jgi:hypothetical protein
MQTQMKKNIKAKQKQKQSVIVIVIVIVHTIAMSRDGMKYFTR